MEQARKKMERGFIPVVPPKETVKSHENMIKDVISSMMRSNTIFSDQTFTRYDKLDITFCGFIFCYGL